MADEFILPPYVTAKSATAVVAFCRQVMGAEGDVVIDAQRFCFIDPFGIAMLGATFFSLREYGAAVRVCGLSPDIGGYLQRMDVFEGVELVDCSLRHGRRLDRSDALVELTRLERTTNSDSIAHQIARALVGRIPDLDPDEPPDDMTGYNYFEQLVEPLQYTLSELLENALTHARRARHFDANVWVASQYYPSKDLVQLGVVDNGCGFLGSLRGNPELHRESHLEAILAGLRPRVSCNRELGVFAGSVNQGVGLTTVARIAERAGGSMVIVSGDGFHNTVGRSYEMGPEHHWQGVGISMQFCRNLLNEVHFRDLLPRLETPPPISLRFE